MSTTTLTTSTESRAISLLGQGIAPAVVASTLGVSESLISQIVSDPTKVQEIVELRYKNLARHNERDLAYDSLEDELLEKIKHMLPMMMRPMDVLRALTAINQAKRRGTSAPESLTNQNTVVNIVLPTAIRESFTLNINNQVIKTGDKDLVTIQPAALENLTKLVNQNGPNSSISPARIGSPSSGTAG